MKCQVFAALMGLAATTVSAQLQQVGPFHLHVKGTKSNSTVDGFLTNCHTGAGISALCYTAGLSDAAGSEYYFNFTGATKVGNDSVGSLIYNLPFIGSNGQLSSAPQTMSLVYYTATNIASPMFGLGGTAFEVGFDSYDKLFGYYYINDSKFVAGVAPTTSIKNMAFYQWAVCWQYFSGYYYQSLGWVQAGAPHNPTCELVSINKV
ncbi:hypothetical protein GGS21DRAFT_489096 [Xylaria nigripes]|nr:hypothetical protein GGS21DRAFT_489096 [Xylaria nigripes]